MQLARISISNFRNFSALDVELAGNVVVVGENQTFLGEEALLRDRGVTIRVLQEPRCVELMARFIAANPAIWNEDIGS